MGIHFINIKNLEWKWDQWCNKDIGSSLFLKIVVVWLFINKTLLNAYVKFKDYRLFEESEGINFQRINNNISKKISYMKFSKDK